MSEKLVCEYHVCDFCKHYIDAGKEKFLGYGHCAIDYEETQAWMGCDEHFICAICQKSILEIWSCL